MKALLITAIALMIIVIGCNIEKNSMVKEPNYLYLGLLPFLAISIYAVFNLQEFKNFIDGNRD